ncbi:MAG: DUF1015 domain-containing protein [Dehalococcoidia bacterium]|nr:DUF1015 domain-containing protein [Dehalococcoidia bacterium]
MTEIRPFRGLRYDPTKVNPSDVIAPPYDVVGADAVKALHSRSPYNAAHLENPAGSERDRYAGAAKLIAQWNKDGALKRDAKAAYYVYEQRAKIPTGTGGSRTVSRRCFFARTRLHRPEEGIIRPHEATLTGPREERMKLLQATKTNISPVFGMFLDPSGDAKKLLAEVAKREPDFEATDAVGDRHRLWAVSAASEVKTLTDAVAASNVTIADGHHRTHTALDYLDLARNAKKGKWTGNEPENFVLMGLIPEDDPGLVILPIHRLIHGEVPGDILLQLSALYRVEAAPSAEAAWEQVQANRLGPFTFGLLGAGGPHSAHVLTARSPQAIENAMPQRISAASKGLDALVLTETILTPVFGITRPVLTQGKRVTFTESLTEAEEAVHHGEAELAFLVNATRVEQVTHVADAGEVMPQKTTFYYPKLATGMVFNPLD